MAENRERNAEILRRLQDKRPFEVARDMGVSYAVVGGVLRRARKRGSDEDDKEDWEEVDAWPDPPLTSMGRLDALYAMMQDVLSASRAATRSAPQTTAR